MTSLEVLTSSLLTTSGARLPYEGAAGYWERQGRLLCGETWVFTWEPLLGGALVTGLVLRSTAYSVPKYREAAR